MITNFFKSIGLYKLNEDKEVHSYDASKYNLTSKSDSEKIIHHKNFLKSVLEDENNRLGYIENKTSQIISQTSIVFYILCLFIPIIINRFENSYLIIKIIIIFLLLITFSFYLLSITNALKNFNIKKFKYPYSDPSNVLNLIDKSSEEFNSELIRDYLHCIKGASIINNKKATNLLHAHKSFKLGNFSTGIIVMCICTMLLFTNKSIDNTITLKNPIEIKNLDSILKSNKSIIIIKKDTFYRKEKNLRIKDSKQTIK
jgi:hypothetical protein